MSDKAGVDWETECKRLTEKMYMEEMKHCEEVACLKEELNSVARRLDECNQAREKLEGQIEIVRLIFGGELRI